MTITVRVYASLRDMVPTRNGEIAVDVPDAATVADVIARLGLPAGVVHMAFVSGVARDESHVLAPGDEVGLFPPIAGGG